jgi:hypothetical protein
VSPDGDSRDLCDRHCGDGITRIVPTRAQSFRRGCRRGLLRPSFSSSSVCLSLDGLKRKDEAQIDKRAKTSHGVFSLPCLISKSECEMEFLIL